MVFVINKLYRDNLIDKQLLMGWKVLCMKKTGKALIDALYEKAEEELKELDQLAKELHEDTARKLGELQKALMKEMKDIEEVIEVLTDMGENTEKLKPFRDAMDNISATYNIDPTKLAKVQLEDREDRGSFTQGRYVFKQEIPQDTEDNKRWHAYYTKKYTQEDSF